MDSKGTEAREGGEGERRNCGDARRRRMDELEDSNWEREGRARA